MPLGPLGWNLLYVRNFDVMRAFYVDVVGLPIRFETEGIVAFATGACVLELMHRPDQDNEREGFERSPLLMSFHVDDFEGTVAELEARGATDHSTVKHIVGVDEPKYRLMQFTDPEGNFFEICEEPLGWFPDAEG